MRPVAAAGAVLALVGLMRLSALGVNPAGDPPPPPAAPPTVAEDAADAAARVVASSVMNGTLDHDALIYKARTVAHLLSAGHESATAGQLDTLLDQLWDARYTSAGLRPGWGLPYAYDAFGDGSTNPSTAIYTYTTAEAILAFLDGYRVLDNAEMLDRAEEAMTTILTDNWGFTSGGQMSPWYSDDASDQNSSNKVVHNVNALTLAGLARIDRYNGSSFDAAKRTGMELLINTQTPADGISGAWRYRWGVKGRNDLTHHAYMVEGTVEADMAIGETAMAYMWNSFLFGTGAIQTSNSNVMGTHKWGPGDALSSLSMVPSWTDEAAILADTIADSIGSNGISSYASATDPRSVSRYGLGTARYAASVLGDGSLFP